MDEAKEEIMEATNSALEKHSYSALSIQNIADEFEKSKSLLYHHYDSKDEILLDFMNHMLETFQNEMLSSQEEDGFEEKFWNKSFMAFNMCRSSEFIKTLEELRAQGLRDDRYRQKFSKLENTFLEEMENLLKIGVDRNVFKSSFQAEKVAQFILSVNQEALRKTAENKEIEDLEEELETYLEYRIYPEDQSE